MIEKTETLIKYYVRTWNEFVLVCAYEFTENFKQLYDNFYSGNA